MLVVRVASALFCKVDAAVPSLENCRSAAIAVPATDNNKVSTTKMSNDFVFISRCSLSVRWLKWYRVNIDCVPFDEFELLSTSFLLLLVYYNRQPKDFPVFEIFGIFNWLELTVTRT